jgi:activator of HSP90 ATPase
MKKILIVLLFATSNLFGQELIKSKATVFISPKDISINRKEINRGASITEKDRIVNVIRVNSLKGKSFFGTEKVKFFQYVDTIISLPLNHLQEKKKMFDEIFSVRGKPIDGYSSIMKIGENFDALIVRNEIEEYVRYSIFSVNQSNSKALNATFVVLKMDSLAGNKAVNDFIKSIKFK